ncbi:MAG: polyhydroxyalkanoate synthesis regulator DNA-binding domain-containing protein [Acidobacteriota bacterium]|nr:polyhydroxyalkanoate synthesis regulator DNA-binding domain-containing protein [Acidobacteriota bacterium]
MEPKTILIKKYENRRLYDSTNSRYVNLDEVAKMLQSGDDVRVVDAATGEDITRLILTQIIVEDAKAPDSNFPIDVLRQMVIASGRASQESALKYMKNMLDIYQNTYRAMAPPLNPFEFLQRRDGTTSVAESQPEAPPAEKRSSKVKTPAAGEVDELKQRVAELEALVSSIASKKAPKKKK